LDMQEEEPGASPLGSRCSRTSSTCLGSGQFGTIDSTNSPPGCRTCQVGCKVQQLNQASQCTVADQLLQPLLPSGSCPWPHCPHCADDVDPGGEIIPFGPERKLGDESEPMTVTDMAGTRSRRSGPYSTRMGTDSRCLRCHSSQQLQKRTVTRNPAAADTAPHLRHSVAPASL
jgi:hypothetical protein